MNIMQKLLKTSKIKYTTLLNKLYTLFADEVYYIGSSETLPPPLSAQEEAMYLDKLLLTPEDKEIKNTLIERNLRLVVYIARKFENTNVCIDDLISIGSIGLIKAINTFNPTKNIKLATYASRCIENEILMHLRKTSNLKTEISIDEPLNVDWDGNELLLSDILGTDSDIINKNLEEETDRQLLFCAIGKLDEREQQIMTMRFGLGGTDERTQKEVADLLGISQSYISRLEKKIISRLKKEILKLS